MIAPLLLAPEILDAPFVCRVFHVARANVDGLEPFGLRVSPYLAFCMFSVLASSVHENNA